jgi:hypothetical protein
MRVKTVCAMSRGGESHRHPGLAGAEISVALFRVLLSYCLISNMAFYSSLKFNCWGSLSTWRIV